jgi:hypothetical protein
VPSTWPVINLSAQPQTCVTFDRHAVYLGTPSSDMKCAANGAGQDVGAVLIQPASGSSGAATVQDPASQVITATAPGIQVTATYGTDEAQVRAVIASASLPAPTVQAPSAASASRPSVSFSAAQPAAAAAAPAEAAQAAAAGPDDGNDIGLGFDACTAPSSGAMSAWRSSSSYRTVGIYIGGEDRACGQPNLTAGWISQQSRAGWSFMPLYVGPQALFGQLSSPTSQGISAAQDAAGEAGALGLGLGTPIYYDMEGGYSLSDNGAVLSLLSAWTSELHRLGYESAVYSSGSYAVALLASNYNRSVMPDIISDADYNGQDTVSDPEFLPAGDWASDQRVHQYDANIEQTHGGVTIDIDQDAVEVRLPFGGSRQPSQAAAQQSGTVDTFFEGSGGTLEHTFFSGSGWAKPANMNAGRIASEPSVVTSKPGDVDVFWKGTDGNLWYEFYTPASGWSGARKIGMGPLGGAPYAVAQQNGTIDVFWKGAGADPSLEHAWQNPGSSWSGPQNLGGNLASDPSPVTSSPGVVDVFFEGSDQALWHAYFSPSGGWHNASRLGMGPLGSGPHATGQLDGTIDVFWKSTGTTPSLEHAWYNAGQGWSGPQSLGGAGEVASAPVAVSSSPGTVEVLFQGVNGGLYWAYFTPSTSWHAPARVSAMGVLGGPPFATGEVSGTTDVFWKGTGSTAALWHGWVNSGPTWQGPQNLGGSVQ